MPDKESRDRYCAECQAHLKDLILHNCKKVEVMRKTFTWVIGILVTVGLAGSMYFLGTTSKLHKIAIENQSMLKSIQRQMP